MLPEIIIIAVGMVTIVVIMALIMNPPEALVKKFYLRKSNTAAKDDRVDKLRGDR
ncbi:MAG: hypothetical protein ACJ746_21555 [Bryobacteraceae bacterium]